MIFLYLCGNLRTNSLPNWETCRKTWSCYWITIKWSICMKMVHSCSSQIMPRNHFVMSSLQDQEYQSALVVSSHEASQHYMALISKKHVRVTNNNKYHWLIITQTKSSGHQLLAHLHWAHCNIMINAMTDNVTMVVRSNIPDPSLIMHSNAPIPSVQVPSKQQAMHDAVSE